MTEQQWKDALSNLLFPYENACPLCQRILTGWERTICDPCNEELKRCLLRPLEGQSSTEPFHWCLSAFAYAGAAQRLIHQLKYNCDATVASVLGLYMCATLLTAPGDLYWDAVVPVPLHPSRLRMRGFNQAEMLAGQIAHCFQLPLRTDLLRRVKASRSQTKRSAQERRLAMEGVFAASNAAGLNILLVDDVLTTGATSGACAKALLNAGAVQVSLITACLA